MPASPIKLITFDLDNTLWDVEPALLRAEQAQYLWLQQHRPAVTRKFNPQAMRDFRVTHYKQHPELAHQISAIRISAVQAMLLAAGYDSDNANAGAQAAFDVFMELRHQVQPYEQALDVLQQLSKEYQLGALTNGNADIFKLELGDCFDFSFSAEQVDASKPLPDMFHAAMSAAQVDNHQVVHVGDNPHHDIYGAKQVGLFTVWMNSGDWRWPRGEPADEEISKLQQLPDAIRRIEAKLA
ncbi:HAD family hydrolase [Halieaceae bacterium IMCC14734]|uniref:HAD family hydrolase n=1 Tax=Candidatus Litorirhabdus singularis TaxID=2518993 RepID=A0ABT3TCK3_9GAMM|nr:HAD family hydrolase [Candidatus Litorirhabdus singularis]MCX2979531.1 HAD family hydrolase [Candidatus Litorirhabdus singularis]